MSTHTSNTSKNSKASTNSEPTTADSTVRPGLRTGEHVVAVQLGAWGPQEVTVRAYSGGGRGGAPYVAVGVGTCLTYAYDTAAVQSLLCTGAAGLCSRAAYTTRSSAADVKDAAGGP